jgi:spore coat polysaccharide biosynthesis predicted glycosyltransferase SpsG
MKPSEQILLESGARFVFRMDASPAIGVGHAIRCVAIAEEVESLGFSSIFVGETSSIGWLEELIDSIPRTTRIKSEELFEIENDCDILVLDSYHLEPNSYFIEKLPWKATVAIVDNSTPSYLVDIYIHPGENFGWQMPKIQWRSTLLEGLSYVPIRKSITSIQHEVRENAEIKIMTIVGGGTDPTKFIENITPVLEDLQIDFEARIFTSNRKISSSDSRIKILSPEDKIELHFSESDIVLTTAGTSAWEVASMGIPMGIAQAVENQNPNYKFFTSKGLALGIGLYENCRWSFSIENLKMLLTSTDKLKSIAREQNSVSLKDGSSRIVHDLADAVVHIESSEE